MKPRSKISNTFFILMLFLGISVVAQEKDLDFLSIEQKEILKEQQQLLDDTRAIVKENLNQEQLKLLNNKSISKEERARLLRQSLTPTQRDLITSKRRLIKQKKNRFKNTLTQRQKAKIRRFLQNRNTKDRRRLVRRIRRLLRNNMN